MMVAGPGSRWREAKSHVCETGECRQEGRSVVGRSGLEGVCAAHARREEGGRERGRQGTLQRGAWPGRRTARKASLRVQGTGRLGRFPKTTYNVTILRGKQHTPAPRDATDVFDQYGDADQWGSHSLAVRISAGQCAGRNFGTTNTPSEPSRPGLETRRREADEPGRARVWGGGVCNEHMDTNQEHYPDQEDGRLVLGRFQFRAWECFLFVFDGISTILNSMFSLLS